jgi:acylphosphatase
MDFSIEMKLKAKIRGTKVHEVGYRTFLMAEVLGQGIKKFAAFNQKENGEQIVIVLVEGDERQIPAFKEFMQNSRPERAVVASVTFEDFQGRVMSVFEYFQLNLNDQLNKGIPALLRIDEKQDMMIEKQDTTIAVLKEVKEDTSDIKNDISALRKDTSEALYEKYEQLSREIAEIKTTLSEIKAKAA